MKKGLIKKAEEEWGDKKKILVILAHPDDPEFFCGATICRWGLLGHEVSYLLLTQGDKGGEKDTSPETLRQVRKIEQLAAAEKLGVKNVRFLENPDGYLVPDLSLREKVVREIRKESPDVVVSGDPTNYFPRPGAINHPDHRAAGQVVLDAVFPASGNYHYFPNLLLEGLEPVQVQELWLTMPTSANIILDVTPFWETKIASLHEHQSQIGNIEQFDARLRSRHTADSTLEDPRYEEKFYRIVFS